jgi:hypothetical protein
VLAPTRLLVSPLIVALLVGPLATVSRADGGCGVAGRPACTILRPAAVGTASARVVPSPADAAECIVLVGGLGSTPEATRDMFRPLVAPFITDPRYVVYTFGADRPEAYAYATDGAIAQNALQLRAFARDLSDECSAIDVVTHSMGGAVADRAFSLGLSGADGVAAYLPLSSPHNGATAAVALRAGVEVDETFAAGASWVARHLGAHDPTTDAMRDLARATAPRPVRGVATVRQRMVHDVAVLRRDHDDPRVDVREHLPAALSIDGLEGHSGIAHSAGAQQVVERTIRDHAVPPEDRPRAHVAVARAASSEIDRRVAEVWLGAGSALVSAALVTKVAVAVADALREARDALLLIEPLPLLQVPPPPVERSR